MAETCLSLAFLGAGRWGPNLIRNLDAREDCWIQWICDADPARLKAIADHYGDIQTTTDWKQAVNDPKVDAVVICTPTVTHYEMAKKALECGKHVFVEKPLATSSTQALELARLAERKKLKLMVGHVFLFNPAIRKMKELLLSKELGKLHYLYCTRTNLGPIRGDVNALWDLAPHDLSILLYLLDEVPLSVNAVGGSYINPPTEDVVFSQLKFPENVMASIHVSWLDPKKVRQVIVVGSRKMLVFDDMEERKLTLVDKNISESSDSAVINDTIQKFRRSIHEGDEIKVDYSEAEPLKTECDAFVRSILLGELQPSSGFLGAGVVHLLEKMTDSMKRGGQFVAIQSAEENIETLPQPTR